MEYTSLTAGDESERNNCDGKVFLVVVPHLMQQFLNKKKKKKKRSLGSMHAREAFPTNKV